MAATRKEVDGWIESAKENKISYILSVCDTWDYDDYPIFCKDLNELTEAYYKHDNVNMQRINEIINIEGDKVTEGLRINSLI